MRCGDTRELSLKEHLARDLRSKTLGLVAGLAGIATGILTPQISNAQLAEYRDDIQNIKASLTRVRLLTKDNKSVYLYMNPDVDKAGTSSFKLLDKTYYYNGRGVYRTKEGTKYEGGRDRVAKVLKSELVTFRTLLKEQDIMFNTIDPKSGKVIDCGTICEYLELSPHTLPYQSFITVGALEELKRQNYVKLGREEAYTPRKDLEETRDSTSGDQLELDSEPQRDHSETNIRQYVYADNGYRYTDNGREYTDVKYKTENQETRSNELTSESREVQFEGRQFKLEEVLLNGYDKDPRAPHLRIFIKPMETWETARPIIINDKRLYLSADKDMYISAEGAANRDPETKVSSLISTREVRFLMLREKYTGKYVYLLTPPGSNDVMEVGSVATSVCALGNETYIGDHAPRYEKTLTFYDGYIRNNLEFFRDDTDYSPLDSSYANQTTDRVWGINAGGMQVQVRSPEETPEEDEFGEDVKDVGKAIFASFVWEVIKAVAAGG